MSNPSAPRLAQQGSSSIALLQAATKNDVILDSWVSIMRALATLDHPTDQEKGELDLLIQTSSRDGGNLFAEAYIQKKNLSAEAVGLLVAELIAQLEESSNLAVLQSLQMALAILENGKSDEKVPSFLVTSLIAASFELIEAPSKPRNLVRAAQQLRSASLYLADIHQYAEANACIQSAVNLIVFEAPSDHLTIANDAAKIAFRSQDRNVIGASVVRYAQIIVNAAVTRPELKVHAFDAVEMAIRNLPDAPSLRSSSIEYLKGILSALQYLRPLQLRLWASIRNEERWPIGVSEEQKVALIANVLQQWDGTTEEWFNAFQKLQGVNSMLEDRRIGLSNTVAPAAAATTAWESWSFEHPELQNAIPHSSSILRHPNLHDYLLTLSHEITHVFSMAGVIGLATTAMRWALLEFDFELWSLSFKLPGYSSEAIRDAMISADGLNPYAWWRLENDDLNPHRLARVEQALELVRKIQILEDTWSPWFEGLAIFGESADPKLDESNYSPVAHVVSQLKDIFVFKLAEEQNRTPLEVTKAEQQHAEDLFAEAIYKAGKSRLRLHLDTYWARYLPGYLAVRSVVSCWRSRFPRMLSGTEAFRVLLHATRWSAFEELVPNVSLPVVEFESQVRDRHKIWLQQLKNVSEQDLERVVGAPGTRLEAGRWESGKLITVSQFGRIDTAPGMQAIANQALNPVFQEPTLERLPQVGEPCATLMDGVFAALRPKEHKLFAGERMLLALAGNRILPIGRVDCPFWILREDRIFVCLIRTTQNDGSGSSSYDLIAFTLTAEDFSAIEQQLALGAGPRVRVTRIADLADLDTDADRGLGRNLLVFQLGEWRLFQPRGLLFGTTKISDSLRVDALARLDESSPVAALHRLSSIRGFAERARMFLERVSDKYSAAEMEFDLGPWRTHVKDICEEVRGRIIGEAPDQVVEDCLKSAISDPNWVATLKKSGLEPLRETDPGRVGELIQLLFLSGQNPVQDVSGEPVQEFRSTIGVQFSNSKFGWDLSTN